MMVLAGLAAAQALAFIVSQALLHTVQYHIELQQIEQNRPDLQGFEELLTASKLAKVVKVVYCTARWYHYPLCGLYRWYLRSQARRQP